MSRVKVQIFTLCAAVLLLFVASVTANAQWNMSAKDKATFTNRPCSNPYISWALYNETYQFAAGGVDCNAANYGSWTTAQQLMANLKAYRDMMKRQGVTMSAPATMSNGHIQQSVLVKGQTSWVVDYGIVAQGAGNIVAQGAGNLLSPNGSNLVSQGGGNFYGTKAVGDTVVQFPGRWVKVTQRSR